MDTQSKIFVAGHNGLVGSAIVRALQERGYTNLLLRSSRELDLRNQAAVDDFFSRLKSQIMCFLRRPRWAASTPTIPIEPSFSTTT